MRLLAYFGLSMITIFSEVSSGARFPNAVEKKIIVSGEKIRPFAELFELQSPVSLRLGRNDAWAVYLLKQDTKEKLLNDNHGSPARYNRLILLNKNGIIMEISPYWLDLGTSFPYHKPGHYEFSSPVIQGDLDQQDDPWNKLVRNLKNRPEWKSEDNVQFHQCHVSSEQIVLCVEVFRARNYGSARIDGHVVTITADLSKSKKQ